MYDDDDLYFLYLLVFVTHVVGVYEDVLNPVDLSTTLLCVGEKFLDVRCTTRRPSGGCSPPAGGEPGYPAGATLPPFQVIRM